MATESKSAERKHTPAVTFKGSVSLNEVCASIPLSTFPTPAAIITIDSTATVADAVRILSAKGILCAPVRDVTAPADASWSQKYLGLVDMTDIVLFMLDAMEGKFDGRPAFMESLTNNAKLMSKPVTEVMHVFRYGPFVPLEDTGSLLDAILVLGKHGLHRLCVVKTGGDIVNFITQFAVIRALRAALPRMPEVAGKSLTELGLAKPTEVASVRLDDGVWTALQTMKTAGVSAVPITGADGGVVGVFSNSDVRLVLGGAPDMYAALFRTLREFMAAKLAKEVDARATVVAVSPTDSLGRVVEMLETLHLHRLFIVDTRNRVTGVVSLGDVLSVLVSEPKDYFGDYFDV